MCVCVCVLSHELAAKVKIFHLFRALCEAPLCQISSLPDMPQLRPSWNSLVTNIETIGKPWEIYENHRKTIGKAIDRNMMVLWNLMGYTLW